MALWSGVSKSDHAGAGVGIFLLLYLVRGMKDYGMIDLDLYGSVSSYESRESSWLQYMHR